MRYGRWRATAGALALAIVAIGAHPVAAEPGDRAIVAGTGEPGYSGDFGAATAAQIRRASAVEVLPNGSFLIADEDDNRVRVVSQPPSGPAIIRTLAGTGAVGFSGDHDLANAAQLSRPRGLAVDAAGAVYVADAGNNRVRRIAPDGVITTVAGSGAAGYSGDGGPARDATFRSIDGLAVDAAGNLFIADGGNHVVRKVDATTGVIGTLAGTGTIGLSDTNMPANRARLARPSDVDVDDAGNVYIADQTARRVVKVDPAGLLRTLAGNGTHGTIAWANAVETGLAYPAAVEVDGSGDSVLIGTEEGVYAVSGVGRIARASAWGSDVPDIANKHSVLAIALRPTGDLLLGVAATVQRVERPVGFISGIVRTGVEGAWLPVAGVRVQVLDPAGQPVSETTSDALGRYKVAASVGQWNLRFTKPGFRTFDFLGSAGAHASGVRVPLGGSVTMANPYLGFLNGAGAAVYGRVASATGAFPASEVVLQKDGDPVALAPIADAEGRFLFAGVAPGSYTLAVTPASPWDRGWWSPATGFGETAQPFTVGADDIRAAVTVPRDVIDVRGVVTDNFGNMLISGTVEAVDPATGELSASSVIDEGGNFHIAYTAPAPPQVALRFVPAWDDNTHTPTWLGQSNEMTPASLVSLTQGDIWVDFPIPSPPYVDG